MKKLIISLLVVSTIFTVGCRSKEQPKADPTNQDIKKDEPITNLKMQLSKPQSDEEIAVLETSMGTIKVRLFPEIAPETVKNFKELINQGKYKDVLIHRVMDDFMIQMGDFENGDGTGGYSYKGPGTTIPDETSSKLKHVYGAVSMAKTQAPNSGGSQFFIVENKDGTSHLNGVHTVFGQVIEGMPIVEKIAAVKTNQAARPLDDIFLKSVTLVKYEAN